MSATILLSCRRTSCSRADNQTKEMNLWNRAPKECRSLRRSAAPLSSTSLLAAIPLAGLASFLFYRLGLGSGLDTGITTSAISLSSVTSRLRGVRGFRGRDKFELELEDVPPCAREVYVALRKETGRDKHECRGLLVRDDIILTSRDCAMHNHTFEMPGISTFRAVPHPELNQAKGMGESPLGFLEAKTPHHYRMVDRPVRRALMFLSRRPHPAGGNATHYEEGSAAPFLACADDDVVRPIAHGFPVDGQMIPLGQLENILPDDILWEHQDIRTARTLRYKSHRWYVRPVTLAAEEEEFRALLREYRGPPGSVSIPEAHDKYTTRASALLEVLDPRGHRHMFCFKNYYLRYRTERPFSGTHFFDWLDFGNGKFLLEKNDALGTFDTMDGDDECYKAEFHTTGLHYFSEEERRRHEVYLAPSPNGKELVARYRHTDEVVPESDPDEPHLYMWDLNETFYVVDDSWDKEAYGRITHAGLMAGRPALAGGKAYFGKGGAVWGINFSSGHYRPEIHAMALMYSYMKHQGWNTTATHWVGRTEWSSADCIETDWRGIEVEGYGVVELLKSCYEVTQSPTWMLKGDV